MTDLPDAGAGGSPDSGSPPAGPGSKSARRADLDAYVAANAGRFTDEALYTTLVAAGHSPEDVRSALARASTLQPQRAAPRAVATIVVAYVAVFALLSIGMLLNNRPGRYLMPDAAGGIGILAGSLGFAFVASLVWVASRRLFGILVLLSIAAYGLTALVSGGSSPILALVIVLVFGGGIALMLRRKAGGGGGEADLAVLLALPMLLLIGVAGICLASGLPIPGSAS
jgi:hypothetical protein